jgi:hypothetical protein
MVVVVVVVVIVVARVLCFDPLGKLDESINTAGPNYIEYSL